MTKLTSFIAEHDLLVFFAAWFGSAIIAYNMGY